MYVYERAENREYKECRESSVCMWKEEKIVNKKLRNWKLLYYNQISGWVEQKQQHTCHPLVAVLSPRRSGMCNQNSPQCPQEGEALLADDIFPQAL